MPSPLKVVATIEDEATGNFVAKIRFIDIKGVRKTTLVPLSMLGQPGKLSNHLNDLGAALTKRAIKAIIATPTLPKSAHQYRARQIGWQETGAFVSFVRCHAALGSRSKLLPPISEFEQRLSASGNLNGWKQEVAQRAGKSSAMMFCVCAAFAAMTLKLVELNTFGFVLVGKSRAGKSMAQLAAGSVIGFADEKQLPSFRATLPALEELTTFFNDHPLIVNEAELIDAGNEFDRAHEVRKFAYRFCQGHSKAFSKVVGRPQTFYETVFIGSMESPSTPRDYFQTGAASGSHVRLFDVPALKKDATNVFDFAPKGLTSSARREWADAQFTAIRTGIKRNHGVAFQPFIEYLQKNRGEAKSILKRESRRFAKSIVGPDDPITRHILKCFGHVVAAGVLASKVGVVPWSPRHIRRAARRCFTRALTCLPTRQTALKALLKRFVDAFEDGRFVEIDNKADFGAAAGFYKGTPSKCTLTIRVDALRTLAGSSPLALSFMGLLAEAGLVQFRNAKGCKSLTEGFATQVTWPDGRRVRSIVIKWRSQRIVAAI